MTDVIKLKDGNYVKIDTVWCDDIEAFETIVVKCDENGKVGFWVDIDEICSFTEEEADEAHKQMVEQWKKKENLYY